MTKPIPKASEKDMNLGKMTKESNIQREIMLACSAQGDTVWRNNVGKGWVAPPDRTTFAPKRMTITINRGDVVLREPYRITWGLCPGSSDLIGIRPVVITPEMVGQTIGVFVALEVKKPGGRVTKNQQQFLDHVNDLGGIGVVVRGAGDLRR